MRTFKFTLDRKSLLLIYTTFIRPILEYADVVWDNITTQDEIELEKIQQDAARIISGGTRLASLQNLYNETALEPLKKRRTKHKLTNFYKMYNSVSPPICAHLSPLALVKDRLIHFVILTIFAAFNVNHNFFHDLSYHQP